ncbi:hypothetical protein [Actomonas aquatica]|uniref:Uncharacterized protein n=1 Tax=Actomonas aquatica TaxID=2866162 RepID=A0ABZ1C520_9BACT|nr:hypothetical protein [Opitutus sp. WL0086]WRQ86433.1 hypothetical protein K1X11_016580 [Opitutus sp. WL0086]
MDGLPIPTILVALWVTVAVVFVLLAKRHARKSSENTRRLAIELGLSIAEQPPVFGVFSRRPEVAGEREGKLTRLERFSTGSGKNRQQWVALAVRPRLRGRLEFRLSPESFGNKVRGLFGYKEIKVGDPRFDRDWYVETNLEAFFRDALLPELRERLQQLRQEGLKGRFETHDGDVRYVEPGSLGSDGQRRRLVLAADMVSTLAEVVEVAAG